MKTTLPETTIEKTFPFRDLSVTLILRGKDSVFEFMDLHHQKYQALIWEPNDHIGLIFERSADAKDLLLSSASKIYPNYFLLSLVSPNISFRMSLDGNGVGIADIRDFRDGGLRKFKFELAIVNLMVALIFDPNSNLPSIAFCWNESEYDPFVVA
jgi:hypothetical protein